MEQLRFGLIMLAIIFASFFHIFPFLKSENEHLAFIRDKAFSKINGTNENIEDNQQLNSSDPEKKIYKLEIDYFQNSERRFDGTFVTDIHFYQYFPVYETCTKSYVDYFGYTRYNYGTRLKSIVKRPGGVIRIRTSFDGKEIYIVNSMNISNLEKEDNKNNWSTIKQVNSNCL